MRPGKQIPSAVVGLLFIVLTLAGPALLSSGPAPGMDTDDMRAGVVRIRAGVDEGEESLNWQTGTGFVIRAERDRHFILTVTHVVKGADKIEIEYRNRPHAFFGAKVVRMQGRDPNGIALLAVSERPPPGTPVLYVEGSAAKDTPVIAIGFPRTGKPWQTTRGKIQAVKTSQIAFTAPVDSGNSGGPLLNSAGRVLGMVTSTRDATGFATAAPHLGKTLAGWDLELPNAPTAPAAGIPFPEEWCAFYPGVLVQNLFATREGYVLFGNRPDGKNEEDDPQNRINQHNKSAILRLDPGLRPVSRTLLAGEPYGTYRNSRLMGVVQRPRGDFFMLEMRTSPRGALHSVRHLDRKGNMLKNLSPRSANQWMTIANSGGNHVILGGPLSTVVRLDPLKGYTWSVHRPGNLMITPYHLLRAGENGAYVLEVHPKNIHHFEAGRFLGSYPLPEGSEFATFAALRSGGVLVALSRKGLKGIPGASGAGGVDSRLIKLNGKFETVWDKTLTLAGSEAVPNFVQELRDGHILAVSYDIVTPAGESYYSIVLLDAAGTEIWRRQILEVDRPGASSHRFEFTTLLERPDGSFLLGGNRRLSKREFEGFVFGMNRKGEFIAPARKPSPAG